MLSQFSITIIFEIISIVFFQFSEFDGHFRFLFVQQTFLLDKIVEEEEEIKQYCFTNFFWNRWEVTSKDVFLNSCTNH